MIQKIAIRGFKSIKNTALELGDINILIGGNGAGKSNFVSFFKFVRVIYHQGLAQASAKVGAEHTLYFGRKKTESIYGKFFFQSPESTTNSYYFEAEPTDQDTLMIVKEAGGYNAVFEDDSQNYHIIPPKGRESQLKTYQTGRPGKDRFDYLRDYLKSFFLYHFHDTGSNSNLRLPGPINDNDYFKEFGDNLPAFLYYLQEKHPKTFKLIEYTIGTVTPFFGSFDLKPDRLNPDNIRLEWKEKGELDKYFNAAHLSDGSLRFIALCTLLLQPNPPKIIILDEPELGLHPAAINKLAGLIKSVASKGIQVIISTQSVNLINLFEPSKIITVDRDNEGASIFKRLHQDDLNQWLKEFSVGDLWEKHVIGGQP